MSDHINLGQEGILVLGAMWLWSSLPEWLALARGSRGRMRWRRAGSVHAALCSLPRVNDIALGIAVMPLRDRSGLLSRQTVYSAPGTTLTCYLVWLVE